MHKYANEDVSLGAWFIGLEVEHIDERNMCCGTPPGMVLQLGSCPNVLNSELDTEYEVKFMYLNST